MPSQIRLSNQTAFFPSSFPNSELRARVSAQRQCPKGLAVCAIVKNEAIYIQEWLAFHLHSGVQHFYLYLNEDDDAGYILITLHPGQTQDRP